VFSLPPKSYFIISIVLTIFVSVIITVTIVIILLAVITIKLTLSKKLAVPSLLAYDTKQIGYLLNMLTC